MHKEDRPLSNGERELLQWVLINGTSEGKKRIHEINSLWVIGSCTCGCATIDLGTKENKNQTKGNSIIIGDAEGISPEGIPIGVIVHMREGQISELEVYSMTGKLPITLPSPANLKSLNE